MRDGAPASARRSRGHDRGEANPALLPLACLLSRHAVFLPRSDASGGQFDAGQKMGY